MRLFYSIILILVLSIPVTSTGEELNIIKEKASTSKLYERAVEFFTRKVPQAFEKQLENSYQYMGLIENIFNEKDVPLDMAYIPLIESGFSHMSVGRGGVVGLWQFARQTGKKYGLKIDKYVDERRDPIKSTHAAADYLNDLYFRFGAWDIAIAAYNAGEGKISRILHRSGRMPAVINSYLARLAAASTVGQDPEGYGLKLKENTGAEEVAFMEVITDKVISFKTLAEQYDTTVSVIRKLNPALLRNETPPYLYSLRLPDRYPE